MGSQDEAVGFIGARTMPGPVLDEEGARHP